MNNPSLKHKHKSGCHSILRDNEGLQPHKAVDTMVKFLFAKWYDEQATVDLAKQTGESRAYVFSVSSETDSERLLTQVQETFEKAKQWEQKTLKKKFGDDLNVRLAFNKDVLELKPHTTMEIVKRLQPWSLRKSSADVKGGVFEDFLSKTFLDDLGQYFTPTPVNDIKRFLVKSSDWTKNKFFVEFYQPKFQFIFKKLHECPYPLHSLKKLSNRMFDGHFGSNRKVDMYQVNGIPYIGVKDVLPSGIFLDELKYISQEKHNELIRSRVVPGNLLITIAGRLSYPAILESDIQETLIPISDKEVQNEIATEVTQRCNKAKSLRIQAENLVNEAKAHVERMILGEEEVA